MLSPCLSSLILLVSTFAPQGRLHSLSENFIPKSGINTASLSEGFTGLNCQLAASELLLPG